MSATTSQATVSEIWGWLADVPDPEIPAISVVDLGIVRDVRWDDSQNPAALIVTVTPTYSGCPAIEVISASIAQALTEHGVEHAEVRMQLSPPWTTDWLGEEAREKLRRYGIAPPSGRADEQVVDISRLSQRALAAMDPVVACPHCGAPQTERVSQFGSTPCKALYRCAKCREPFDYFKCH